MYFFTISLICEEMHLFLQAYNDFFLSLTGFEFIRSSFAVINDSYK